MDVISRLLSRIDDFGTPLWQPEELYLKRNAMLATAGQVHTDIYYVKSGALRLYYPTKDGENTIRLAYPGSIFAVLDSFITAKPTVYNVQAIRASELRVMKKAEFDAFINSDSTNLQLWNQILGYTVTALLERETDLLTATPKERYERVLQRSPQLFQHIPHRHIASYLRMAPETLSRLQKS
jgi:CRP/FNR family transcriptional regulator, anaerobic regulatory protein